MLPRGCDATGETPVCCASCDWVSHARVWLTEWDAEQVTTRKAKVNRVEALERLCGICPPAQKTYQHAVEKLFENCQKMMNARFERTLRAAASSDRSAF